MNKREFLKALGGSSLSLVAGGIINGPGCRIEADDRPRKNWAWITTDVKTAGSEWKRQCAVMRQAGIDCVLPEVYDSRHAYYGSKRLPVEDTWLEKIAPIARAEGLQVHAWMWSMPCNLESVRKQHPDWFAVNRKGESAAEKPAYVEYYRFLCPSRPEVQAFVQSTVAELAAYDAIDGIHLDYIRYPDVILAEALQPKYGIVQDREYPEYDYCYCELCRSEFQKKTGLDPLKLQDPPASAEWRQFRYDRITLLVNDKLIPIAHKRKKAVTAAVFPNWQMVRQQWSAWKLDSVLPMLYHGFYNQDLNWIREETKKGVRALSNRTPLYSGLFVPQLPPDLLVKAVEAAFQGGASGVSLFSARAMTEEHWQRFSKAVKKAG